MHNGAIPGFSSYIAFLPNDGIGFASLINMADRPDVNEGIFRGLIERMLDLPKKVAIAECVMILRAKHLTHRNKQSCTIGKTSTSC